MKHKLIIGMVCVWFAAGLTACGNRTGEQTASENSNNMNGMEKVMGDSMGIEQETDLQGKAVGMCAKLPMDADGIVRLSRIEVHPEYLDDYMKYAAEVGEVSLRTEPGVLTMYALQEKEHPCIITILETYANEAAYSSHIASAHFRKYKQETLHMVKSLDLIDQKPLNPANCIENYMR